MRSPTLHGQLDTAETEGPPAVRVLVQVSLMNRSSPIGGDRGSRSSSRGRRVSTGAHKGQTPEERDLRLVVEVP
ncbi:hypothetical protein EYF80_066268 [Liparis tanakae]|uniref:Uncharacterized protein n=1 Tax=Liparis tanakae TaxID=230148 RepID=A0A4Z2E4W3_9TELE|nr:hypothetical protein EYF80_066268 [Liparis tanakae]